MNAGSCLAQPNATQVKVEAVLKRILGEPLIEMYPNGFLPIWGSENFLQIHFDTGLVKGKQSL
jgi:hypothetical protein